MLLQVLAATLFVFVVWSLFRFAMDLRYSKAVRERSRRAEESRGRRVVAEIPTACGELAFFLEDAEGFYWGDAAARKRDLVGARLMLDGAVMAETARAGAVLPPAAQLEPPEGREGWDVALYRGVEGSVLRVPCGTLREGVSREAAAHVFHAVSAAWAPGPASTETRRA